MSAQLGTMDPLGVFCNGGCEPKGKLVFKHSEKSKKKADAKSGPDESSGPDDKNRTDRTVRTLPFSFIC